MKLKIYQFALGAGGATFLIEREKLITQPDDFLIHALKAGLNEHNYLFVD